MANYAPSNFGVDKKFLNDVWDKAKLFGIDLAVICEKHKIANPLAYRGERIPLALVAPLYDAVGYELQMPDYIYMILSHVKTMDHPMIQLGLCCNTIGEAIQVLCRYSNMASDTCRFSLSKKGYDYLVQAREHSNIYISPIQIEALLYAGSRQIRLWANMTSSQDVCVHFRHAPRFDVERYIEYFCCPVKFQQPINQVIYGQHIHDINIIDADKARAEYFVTILKRYETMILAEADLAKHVQQLFIQRMAFGEPDQFEIASVLNISTRSLHRQLKELGTSFRKLTEEARLAVAQTELEFSNHSIQEIALALGYSDRRAFYRAFRRWTGMTPDEWRKDRLNNN
jgi:AraC-like DNA-binding protein